VRIFTLPGVFRPRSDSWMLADLLAGDPHLPGARVLDLCTGSGALAITAARAGAREVVAVDVSRRSVLTARANAWLNGVRLSALRGDLFAPVAGERFDLIVSNPPYLPSTDDQLPRAGARRAWEAGADGRVLLDRIAEGAPRHLREGGALWLVHSSVCDPALTVRRLSERGLSAEVVRSEAGPLGPLLRARAPLLAERGMIDEDRMEEELVAIRATG